MGTGNTWINAGIGAVITVGLSFTGFSPLLGGGVAGYLQDETPRDGARVGAIAGGIAALPLLLIVLVGFAFFVGVPGVAGGMPTGVEFVVILLILVPIMLTWFVVLSAVGGYLGGYIRNNT